MRFVLAFALCAAALSLGGCGGGSSGGGPGFCNPGQTAAVTIRSTGFTPNNVCVQPNGGQLFFNNQDTVAHTIVSPDCTELNVGPIAPAGSLPATFGGAGNKTCSFHDSVNASNAAFNGSVAVNTGQVTGDYP